jgi:nucleoid-associated protein YgaU
MTATYVGRHNTTMVLPEADMPRSDDAPGAQRYTVKDGDTLVDIASRFGIDGGWEALYEKNLWILGGNPNDLLPGQRLAL